jgi:FeS assembly protein IscX
LGRTPPSETRRYFDPNFDQSLTRLDVEARVGEESENQMKLTWKDAEEIAWALMDKYPDQDPLRLSFPKLHKMVLELEDFADTPDGSNERLLEGIQMAWYEENR